MKHTNRFIGLQGIGFPFNCSGNHKLCRIDRVKLGFCQIMSEEYYIFVSKYYIKITKDKPLECGSHRWKSKWLNNKMQSNKWIKSD